jgi:DNA replication and repair protein RecF
MAFSSIRVSSFRNLKDGDVCVAADRVLLVGENGQGKTNFLEALYYLSYGSSFRGSSDAEAAKAGSSSFSLAGSFGPAGAAKNGLEQTISVGWDAGAKTIKIDGKPVKDRKELIERNPAIVFCHEDYGFAAGEPERRRFFFDQTAGLVSLGYIDVLRDYKRILKQRNAALKEGRQEIVGLLDGQLAAKGFELVAARSRLRDDISDTFARRFEAVSLLGEEVRIAYKPSWPADAGIDGILAKLESRRAEELALGTSLSGPHRDRWSFALGSADFAAKASTGQLRLLSLTLRMVQAEYFTQRVGRLPILLLDDVLLELDRGRRARFLELLPSSAQAFFTFLPGESWEENRTGSSLEYEVRDGKVEN